MTKTILIVDDFESSRNILGKTLESAGYNVLHGNDGESALKILDKLPVDLVITDLNMPGMDGISLIKNIRLREDYQFTPVLLLTTNSKNDKKELAKEAGATGWIEKPFQVEALLNNIRKMVR
jgi:two-component system chemotaxis response regulator CheY